jgi:hypothetical protein
MDALGKWFQKRSGWAAAGWEQARVNRFSLEHFGLLSMEEAGHFETGTEGLAGEVLRTGTLVAVGGQFLRQDPEDGHSPRGTNGSPG